MNTADFGYQLRTRRGHNRSRNIIGREMDHEHGIHLQGEVSGVSHRRTFARNHGSGISDYGWTRLPASIDRLKLSSHRSHLATMQKGPITYSIGSSRRLELIIAFFAYSKSEDGLIVRLAECKKIRGSKGWGTACPSSLSAMESRRQHLKTLQINAHPHDVWVSGPDDLRLRLPRF